MSARRSGGRLLIVSHTPHYRDGGTVRGWGATVREVDHLASLFDEVVHLACVHDEPAPASALGYRSPNVRLRLVPAAGGTTVTAKAGALGRLPSYAAAIARELRLADAVHVRAPAAIAMVAMALLSVRRRPRRRWFKYAGSWTAAPGQPRSYRLQRWWLRTGFRSSLVTVNGVVAGERRGIRSLLNPCLEEDELEAGRRAAAAKRLSDHVSLLYVGALMEFKGPHRVVEAAAGLRRAGVPVTVELVGDGPMRPAIEQIEAAAGPGLATLHGWMPRPRLGELLAAAHFVVLPSRSEGWPKVLGEGMAYGAVPIASTAGSIPHYLGELGVGRAVGADDVPALQAAIGGYFEQPARWAAESARGVAAAPELGYARFVERIGELLGALPVTGPSWS